LCINDHIEKTVVDDFLTTEDVGQNPTVRSPKSGGNSSGKPGQTEARLRSFGCNGSCLSAGKRAGSNNCGDVRRLRG
jgi:hypothetical protein